METESVFRMLCKCLWVAKLALLPSGGVLQSNVTEVLISLMQQIKVRKLPVLVQKYLPTAWALDRAHSAKEQMGLTMKGWISSDQQHLTKTQKLESSWSDRRQEYSWAVKLNTTKQANITTPVSLGQFGLHFIIFFSCLFALVLNWHGFILPLTVTASKFVCCCVLVPICQLWNLYDS